MNFNREHPKKERGNTMKKYYVSGKEITEAEARKIERKNNEYLASGNVEDMLKIKFIVVI